MLIVDIVLLLFLLGFIGAGAKDGFVHTAGRLIGSIIGFVIARAYYVPASALIGWFVPSGWARVISFIIIFILVTRVTGFLVKLADGAFSILKFLPFLKSIDKLLGAVIGLAEGVIVMGGIIYVVKILNVLPTVAKWLQGSLVAPYIQNTFTTLMKLLL